MNDSNEMLNYPFVPDILKKKKNSHSDYDIYKPIKILTSLIYEYF